ncbi:MULTISPECIES: hypothetical protein [unclassified Nocardiopsis]|uniref:hypothetical protein n=1 Tax=unclassified Nocardiopsis TaxID=2649073 RepID=UPI0033D754CE
MRTPDASMPTPARDPLRSVHWSPATALMAPVVLVACFVLLLELGELAWEISLWFGVGGFVLVLLLLWAWCVSAVGYVTLVREDGLVTGGFRTLTRVRWIDVERVRVTEDALIEIRTRDGGLVVVRTYWRSRPTMFLGTGPAERMAERIAARADAVREERVWHDDGLSRVRRSWSPIPVLMAPVAYGLTWWGSFLAANWYL